MHTDNPNPDNHRPHSSLSIPITPVVDAKQENTGKEKRDHWYLLQGILFAASITLVALLLFSPALGLDILWNILIPAAPVLIVIAPGLWRNICPMATMNYLPQHLGISMEGTMSRRGAALLGLLSLVLLFLIVPYRHIGLDHNGPMSALMLIAAAILAFGFGIAFKGRGGWCRTLCPIHPVERLYGQAPAVSFRNARCAQCTHCTVPCPDSIRSMNPAINGQPFLAGMSGHVMIGSFAGFVWGWFQIPNYDGLITTHHYLSAYLWPFGGALTALAIYALLYRWLFKTKPARRTLIRIFATAAVSIYYWFRIPALLGLGPHHGTGMLYDLTGTLPVWSEDLSHLVTTSFFIWFILLRKAPGLSWLNRPFVAPKRGQQPLHQHHSY